MLAVSLAGCGGASRHPSAAASAQTVLQSTSRQVSFEQLRLSIKRLYRTYPGISSFTASEVEYAPRTRDKVLSVCWHGGRERDARALEAAKIAGCAPLVFFFYRYGRSAHAADSIDVARDVYWFAVDNVSGPFDARKTLNALLENWGIP